MRTQIMKVSFTWLLGASCRRKHFSPLSGHCQNSRSCRLTAELCHEETGGAGAVSGKHQAADTGGTGLLAVSLAQIAQRDELAPKAGTLWLLRVQSPDPCAHGPAVLATKVPLALPETCQPLHLVPAALLRDNREGASGCAENCGDLSSWHHSPLAYRMSQS